MQCLLFVAEPGASRRAAKNIVKRSAPGVLAVWKTCGAHSCAGELSVDSKVHAGRPLIEFPTMPKPEPGEAERATRKPAPVA
ncbi:hypothetical protein [Intrasporangium sp. YIM S08009]|uniref:hypothetical protein n=1 Tax=Intrasporangium zincisolvens TaxID=3080018 RepID=UPI002B0612DB|nr:hypothetical protein [Intrasporangium sp. YIM S08009]